jgi:hypothetical protein
MWIVRPGFKTSLPLALATTTDLTRPQALADVSIFDAYATEEHRNYAITAVAVVALSGTAVAEARPVSPTMLPQRNSSSICRMGQWSSSVVAMAVGSFQLPAPIRTSAGSFMSQCPSPTSGRPQVSSFRSFRTGALLSGALRSSLGARATFGLIRQIAATYAADVAPVEAGFMAASQFPIAEAVFGTPTTASAWHTKPSYAILTTRDLAANYERSGAKVTMMEAVMPSTRVTEEAANSSTAH